MMSRPRLQVILLASALMLPCLFYLSTFLSDQGSGLAFAMLRQMGNPPWIAIALSYGVADALSVLPVALVVCGPMGYRSKSALAMDAVIVSLLVSAVYLGVMAWVASIGIYTVCTLVALGVFNYGAFKWARMLGESPG